MTTFLPKEVLAGLDAARLAALKKSSRLRLVVDDQIYPILRLWSTGFALDVSDAPHLRGLVDLYDGANHLYQCLIVALEEENGELIFEFKRSTVAADTAPLDFFREKNTPVALLRQG
ncbi:MAG: hypothetical protein ABJI96_06450 [Paracoccaceae bacterium]